MKRIILNLTAAWFVLGGSGVAAVAACAGLRVEASVQITGGELTLADLLGADTCATVRRIAASLGLGAAPLAGSVRVLDRLEVRGLLENLASASGQKDQAVENLPAQIVVRRGGVKKSCAAIAGFALRSASRGGNDALSLENFNCAGAQLIPEGASLALTKTIWNAALQRWEFSLRCTKPEDCVPFMVWARAISSGKAYDSGLPFMQLSSLRKSSQAYGAESERLIKPGQTATLRWDEGGIRTVSPVTCLDGGTLGQTVRVQFKNARRILRAKVMSDGSLRAAGL
jgi:hypothetical protein